MTATPFDPWDWLGVHCGGFHRVVDQHIIDVLSWLSEEGTVDGAITSGGPSEYFTQLICTLLCNTDAFEFDDDPTQLRFVGDERFRTLDQLIEAWDNWYGEHYR